MLRCSAKRAGASSGASRRRPTRGCLTRVPPVRVPQRDDRLGRGFLRGSGRCLTICLGKYPAGC